MTTESCILCGGSLAIGKTNLEHYIPATLIRNFEKLGVPPQWTHAKRQNRYGPFDVSQILPISQHREWATVRVHEKCNLDASPMCQDLKRFINGEQVDTSRIKSYYAQLWHYSDPDEISVSLGFCSNRNLVYRPGFLSLGRLGIWAHHGRDLGESGVEGHYHTIYLGTREELEKIQ
jgi:hypothetical protein